MATSSAMPWPQQLLGLPCFGGGKAAADDAPLPIVREDSAHQRHHSGASSGMRTSDKSSSSGGPSTARMALSEPTPWHEPGRGFPGSTRSASIQGSRSRRDTSPALQLAGQRRRQSSRRSGSQREPQQPARSPDDWHCLRRFAFVGDISSSPAAGTVTKLMLNRKTEELVSIKFLDRRRGAVDGATKGEILNHRRLHSPHIARFKEAFVTDNYLAVVTENASGGALHQHIRHKGRLPEEEARRYFRQLLTALAHCHGQGVYHRGLQLGALRFDAVGGLVLTDFGYSGAKLAASGEAADVSDRTASPAFTPPEVLLGHSIVNASYDGESLDVWACGIILYVMVFGGFPFEDSVRGAPRSSRNIIKRLVRLQYRFPSGIAASQAVKDLLSRVFVKSAAERIDFAGLATHPWVTDGGALPLVATADTPQAGTPTRLSTPSADLLSGPSTLLGRLASSIEFSQAEAASASEPLQRSSSGLFGAWRSGRDKSQSDADIAAVVKRALVRPS